jgi:hypothetical protein
MTSLQKSAKWLAMGGGALALVMSLWLGVIGYQLSGVSKQANGSAIRAPEFAEFVVFANLEVASLPRISGLSPDAIVRGAGPLIIFEWIAEFENGRSSDRLLAIKPVISGVVPGSLSERIGVRAGDELATVYGLPVESVFAVLSALDERASQTARITLRRAGKLFSAELVAPVGELVTAESSGFLFNAPEGLNVVGPKEVSRLATQFEQGYVSLIPMEWRTLYLEGVARFALELKAYIESQSKLNAGDIGFIKVGDMLSWYHSNFSQRLARYAQSLETLRARQDSLMSQLGDAALGFAGAVLLFILALAVLIMQRRVS